ncbi:hypothetical protein ACF0H5_008959 [Mactra antiquata]
MESKVFIFAVLFLCMYESYGDKCKFSIEEEIILKQGKLDLKTNFLERALENTAEEFELTNSKIESLEEENAHLKDLLDLVARFSSGAPYISALRGGHCYDGAAPNEYSGTIASTTNGKICQRWDSQYPHEHEYIDASSYPEGSLTDAENYCRDPSNSGFTWCYTTDPDDRWGPCDVTRCETEWNDDFCYHFNETASDYDGSLDTTVTGKTCQSWYSQYPHEHDYTNPSQFHGSSIYSSQNYCRDPEGWGLPWCYTTDPNSRWEVCDIFKCL